MRGLKHNFYPHFPAILQQPCCCCFMQNGRRLHHQTLRTLFFFRQSVLDYNQLQVCHHPISTPAVTDTIGLQCHPVVFLQFNPTYLHRNKLQLRQSRRPLLSDDVRYHKTAAWQVIVITGCAGGNVYYDELAVGFSNLDKQWHDYKTNKNKINAKQEMNICHFLHPGKNTLDLLVTLFSFVFFPLPSCVLYIHVFFFFL